MTDEFLKTEYKRVPLQPRESTITALVKWAVNSERCYAHYGGKHSEQKCKNKEMIIAFSEWSGEKNAAKIMEDLPLNLETLDNVLEDK